VTRVLGCATILTAMMTSDPSLPRPAQPSTQQVGRLTLPVSGTNSPVAASDVR